MARMCYSFLLVMSTLWLLEGVYFEVEEKPKKKCVLTKSRLMLAADCHRLDLTEIPTDLDAAIQILDISYNRLRQLPCDAFDGYPSISMLYLYDNLLTNLEDGVFMTLPKLEVLDLSLNGLQTIPIDVVSLPKIRKLYLDRNHLGTKGFQVMENTEIKSPLLYLSTAYCGLQTVPPLEAFPDLTILNVSGNNIQTIRPEQLAPACHLEVLDLNSNEHLFENNDCDCQLLQSYLTEKKIRLMPPFQLTCGVKDAFQQSDDCGNSSLPSPAAESIYSQCKDQKLLQIQEQQVRKAWFISVAVIIVVLVAVLVSIVCWRRHSRRRAEKRGKGGTVQNNNLNRPDNPEGAESDPHSNLLREVDRGFNITTIQNM